MRKRHNPFIVENVRAKLASLGNFVELQKMYSASLPQIPDHNTPKFWDNLNVPANPKVIINPMEKDRHRIVARLIKGEHLCILHIGFGSGNLEREYFQNHSQEMIRWHGIDIS